MRSTVLLVDDSKLVQKLYHHKLLLASYRVLVAGTGEDALEMLAENPVDLVMLDMSLPAMDGLAVLRRIRADAAFDHIPVVVLSGREQGQTVEKARNLGADEYLVKSTTTADNVIERIRHVLDGKRGRQVPESFRIGIDPISLDAHKLATALGLEMLTCRQCKTSMIVELAKLGSDTRTQGARFEATIVCRACGRTP